MMGCKNLMVEDEGKIYEDIFDTDGGNSQVHICSLSMKKLRIKIGLNFSKLCGQKVMIVENLAMLTTLSVKRI